MWVAPNEFASLPAHCEPSTPFLHWISVTFNTCVPSPLGLASTVLGICSILSWLFAQVPQIIKNFQLHSTSGLSIYFLAEWLFGDASNLLGSIFTQQATWQVVLASYYCIVDCVLVGQWIWYEHLRHGRVVRRLRWWRWARNEGPDDHRRRKRSKKNAPGGPIGGTQNDSTQGLAGQSLSINSKKGIPITPSAQDSDTPPTGSPATLQSFLRVPPFSYSPSGSTLNNTLNNSPAGSQPRLVPRPPHTGSPIPSPKGLLYVSLLLAIVAQASPTGSATANANPFISALELSDISAAEWAGRIFSWLSTVLYLGSRLPQLLHNASRRSTSGLSPTLFIAAFCGNLFYSTSLLTNPSLWYNLGPYGGGGWAGPEGSERLTWALRAAPFWLGAAGVLVMDGLMGVQFIIYREKGDKVAEVLVVEDEQARGPSKWKRVTGWMRGWIPGPGERRKRRDMLDGDTETETNTETESLLSTNFDAESIRSYGTGGV